MSVLLYDVYMIKAMLWCCSVACEGTSAIRQTACTEFATSPLCGATEYRSAGLWCRRTTATSLWCPGTDDEVAASGWWRHDAGSWFPFWLDVAHASILPAILAGKCQRYHYYQVGNGNHVWVLHHTCLSTQK